MSQKTDLELKTNQKWGSQKDIGKLCHACLCQAPLLLSAYIGKSAASQGTASQCQTRLPTKRRRVMKRYETANLNN